MQRLIDADALSELVGEPIEVFLSRLDLKLPPTIEAEPVRHGKWIVTDGKDEQYGYVCRCSVCGTSTIGDSDRYCGWCGARMDEKCA